MILSTVSCLQSDNDVSTSNTGSVATHVPLVSRTGTLPHDIPFHLWIRRQQYQYDSPSLPPPPSLVITLGVLCCVA